MTPQELQSALKVAVKDLEAPKQFLGDIGAAALASSQRFTPVRTGALRDSEYVFVGDNYVSLVSDLEYAPFVHEGTRYMEGRPFFTQGIEDAMPNIERYMQVYGDALFAKVARE